jgi:hypothetical protein
MPVDSSTAKVIDFDHLVNLAEQRLEFQKKIIPIALKITNPSDWTNQSGKPWPSGSAVEKIRNLFGISIIDIKEKREDLEGQSGYLYTYSGTFKFANTQIDAIGTCSSKDQFFAKTKKGYRPVEEIDQGNIKKAAYTNMMVNGITRILGMRNLTWSQLEQAAVDIKQIPKVEYTGGFDKTEASAMRKPNYNYCAKLYIS